MGDDSDPDSRTIFCGNLSERVNEEILYELFLQAGPVEKVKIPADPNRQTNFGFVTFQHGCSVDYALSLFEDTRLYDMKLNLKRRDQNQRMNQQNNRNNPTVDNSAYLQMGVGLIQLSNMYQNMTPQTYPCYQENTYSGSQNRYQLNRSPLHNRHQSSSHHTPSGRYDNYRSDKRYDVYEDSHSNNNQARNNKRHKR